MDTTKADILKPLVDFLISEGAREVYLLGSWGTDRQRSVSDLDLAVTGLPPEKFLTVLTKLYELAEMPVDLIDLDRPSPVIHCIREMGELRRVG